MKPEDFKKLSKAEKRVAIAQDVIAQIKANKYIPSQGSYIDTDNFTFGPLQQQLETIKDCEVCALGACMLSIVKYENTIDAVEISEDANFWSPEAKNMLENLFDAEQIGLIECAFEEGNPNYYEKILGKRFNGDLNRDAINFADDYYTDSERLEAIMLNIIENKGTFRP